MKVTSIHAALLLQMLLGIGDITAKRLVDHSESTKAVLNETKINLLKIKGIGAFHLQGFRSIRALFSCSNGRGKDFWKINNIAIAVPFS